MTRRRSNVQESQITRQEWKRIITIIKLWTKWGQHSYRYFSPKHVSRGKKTKPWIRGQTQYCFLSYSSISPPRVASRLLTAMVLARCWAQKSFAFPIPPLWSPWSLRMAEMAANRCLAMAPREASPPKGGRRANHRQLILPQLPTAKFRQLNFEKIRCNRLTV